VKRRSKKPAGKHDRENQTDSLFQTVILLRPRI